MEKTREQLSLEQIRDRSNWPRWPWLPMKRWKDGQLECATLHADEDGDNNPRLHLTNLHVIRSYFPMPEMQTLQYENFQAMVNDGWVVD